MAETEVFRFNLTISTPDSTDEEMDRMTRQLFMELKDLEVESVSLASSDIAPLGTKGLDSVTVGTIVMAVLPAMLPKVLEFLQAWSLQRKDRTIKFKGKIANQQIDFEGSFDEMEKMMALLEKKQKRRKK